MLLRVISDECVDLGIVEIEDGLVTLLLAVSHQGNKRRYVEQLSVVRNDSRCLNWILKYPFNIHVHAASCSSS